MSQVTIGRSEGNDLVLAEGEVSRRHARIYADDQGILQVADMGSANGTFVDGEKVETPVPLRPGAVVLVGGYEISLKSADMPDTRSLPNAIGGPDLVFRAVSDPWRGQVFPIRGRMAIGRNASSEICLDDESVSRLHAEVRVGEDGAVRLVDLGSANGTLVQGETVTHEAVLEPGSLVKFGSVELVVEAEGATVSERRRDPVRSIPAPAPARRGGPKAAALLVLGLAGAGMALFAWQGGTLPFLQEDVVEVTREAPKTPLPAPAAQTGPSLEELLKGCRAAVLPSGDSEPSWVVAEAACGKALDAEPISPEALRLAEKVRQEKEAQAHFKAAEKALLRRKDEEVLAELGKIPRTSFYYPRAAKRLDEANERVQRDAREDCLRLSKVRSYARAVSACERYMLLACQGESRQELVLPKGKRWKLVGKLGRNDWRPKEPAYLALLAARAKVNRRAPPWVCPAEVATSEDPSYQAAEAAAGKALLQWYPDPLVAGAVHEYWRGRVAEGEAKVEAVLKDPAQAQNHDQVKALGHDMLTVQLLSKQGQTYLAEGNLDRGAATFEEALALDHKLVRETVREFPSYFRAAIQKAMAEAAFAKGREWAGRKDFPRACKEWKRGFRFNRGHSELNRSVVSCDEKAAEALGASKTCTDLARALELAVGPEDLAEAGLDEGAAVSPETAKETAARTVVRERIVRAKAQRSCP